MVLSIVILSVTLSLDALFAGFSYGLSGTRIPLVSKLIICAFSVFYAAIAIVLGSALASLLPVFAGKLIGAAVLFLLGVSMLIKAKLKKKKEKSGRKESENPKTLCRIIIKSLGITIEILKNNPCAVDMDSSGIIDIKEALLLGFALSIDSLGAGIGSALSGLRGFYIPPAVGLCQLAFLSAGLFAGSFFLKRKEKLPSKCDAVTTVLPGILLMVLSLLRLF